VFDEPHQGRNWRDAEQHIQRKHGPACLLCKSTQMMIQTSQSLASKSSPSIVCPQLPVLQAHQEDLHGWLH
jgi:hypothetical protein